MTNGIKINQTVAILCDGNNVERSIQSMTGENVMINWDTLIPKLLNGRGLNRLIYFREGKHISHKLADRLHEKFYGSVVPCHKSADIPLSIKATQLSSKVDTIIIMSGDSDYVDLVSHLKSEGVRVEAAAVRANTARILFDIVDHFHEINKHDVFSYTSKKRTNFQQRKPETKANGAEKPIEANRSTQIKPPTKPAVKAPVKPAAKAPTQNHAQQVIKSLGKPPERKSEQDFLQNLAIEDEREQSRIESSTATKKSPVTTKKKESMLARAIKKVVNKAPAKKTVAPKKTPKKTAEPKKKAPAKKVTKKKTTKTTAKKK